MPDIKQSCSANSCKVLATNMLHFTCSDFCRRSGRRCVAAWEDADNGCSAKQTLTCDETFGETSDLLCECAPEVLGLTALGQAQAAADAVRSLSYGAEGGCQGMPDVEKSCSDNGCRVLATNMKHSSCQAYCVRTGRSCSAAYEELDETCGIKEVRSCDETYHDTSDLICECHAHAGLGAEMGKDLGAGWTWQLVWADEFDGLFVDRSHWHLENAGGGFGNHELQFYRSHNVHVKNGHLVLTAKCENYKGHAFTSAKMITRQKAQWGPGHRVEVRAKLPVGRGTWPAIWMLPAEKRYGGWPRSGEIDIVETVGCSPNHVHGTVHTKAYNHMRNTQAYGIVSSNVSEWHTYALDWTTAGMQWYVDGQLFATFAPSEHDSDKWPFDQEFYLILNVAVGGSWGGSCLDRGWPSCTSPEEFGQDQVMEVDYARVYRQA